MTLFGSPISAVDLQVEPAGSAAASSRVLKTNGSHPDAPVRKGHKQEDEEDESLPSTKADMNKILTLLTKMQTENEKTNVSVKKMQKDVDEVKKEMKSTNEAVVALGSEVWEAIGLQKKELESVRAKVMAPPAFSARTSAWATPLAGTHPAQAIEDDEKSRTITFGNWPTGTASQTIVDFIDTHMKNSKDDLVEDEGTFAFGKQTASRGAARFKTTALMLKYLRKQETNTKIKTDNMTIYINRDIHKPQEEIDKDRAIRKLVRTVIETETAAGTTDTDATRRSIDAKYGKGIVNYKGIKIGEYKNGKMELFGEAKSLKPKFDELMEQ